jgi:hypothetical protein
MSGKERRLLPVHPLIRDAADLWIGRPEATGAESRCEVADDHVRFPEHEAVVLERRDASVRVERDVLRRIETPELATGVDALVRDAELADAHMTFCTLLEVVRPQIFIIVVSSGSANLARYRAGRWGSRGSAVR